MPISRSPRARDDLPLVGRVEEVGVLRAALESVRQGAGAAVLIEGTAGLGKTRLLTEALRIAGGLGLRTWSATAEELERGRPLAVLVRALDLTGCADDPARAALAGDLARLDALDDSLLDHLPGAIWQVADRMVGLVEGAAGDGPAVLVLDDLHLADPLTLAVLVALGRRLPRLAVGLLAAFRPVPGTPGIHRLVEVLGSSPGQHVVLEELDECESRQLLAACLGSPPRAGIADLARAAGGNPFYLLEVADVGREETGGRLPTRLRDAVVRHLRGMTEEEVGVLRTAAVLGSPFSVLELAAACRLDPVRLVPLMERFIGLHLLGEACGTDRLVFRHDLVRAAVYETVPAALRAALHAGVARSLAAAGAPPPRVAAHVALGATPGDPVALDWLRRGADELLGHDPDGAAELLQRALDLAGDAPATRRAGIRARLVEALARAGRTEAARRTASALPRCSGSAEAELSLRRGLAIVAFLEGGVAGAAAELAEQVRAGSAVPSRTLAELALFQVASADLEGARTSVAQAARAGDGDRAAAVLGLCVQALLALYDCRLESGIDTAVEAVALADAEDGPRREAHHYHPTFFHALALTDADASDAGAEAVRRGRRLCEELGTAWAPPLYASVAATRLLKAGDLADAEAEAEAARDFTDEFDVSVGAVWPHALLARIALLRGDRDAAVASLQRGEREVTEKGLQFGTDLLLLARAEVLAADGAPDAARDLLALAWSQATDLGLSNVHRVLGPPLARLLADGGRQRDAADVADTLAPVADRTEVPSVRAAAVQCRGLATGDADVLLGAVELWRRSSRPVDLAEAALDAGAALVRRGRRPEAGAVLGEAHVTALDLGATGLAGRIAEHLPRRRPRRSQRPARPQTGWGSLTPSEEQVVRLLAEGLPNGQIADRLFLSRRTVESHLYHVFTKLGVRTRAELAVQAAVRLQ